MLRRIAIPIPIKTECSVDCPSLRLMNIKRAINGISCRLRSLDISILLLSWLISRSDFDKRVNSFVSYRAQPDHISSLSLRGYDQGVPDKISPDTIRYLTSLLIFNLFIHLRRVRLDFGGPSVFFQWSSKLLLFDLKRLFGWFKSKNQTSR